MRFEPTFRSVRMRPTDGPSNGSETLSRIRSLADYTIAMLESSFRKRQAAVVDDLYVWGRCPRRRSWRSHAGHAVSPQAQRGRRFSAFEATWAVNLASARKSLARNRKSYTGVAATKGLSPLCEGRIVLQKLDDQIGESARVDPKLDNALELQKVSTLLIQESNVTALYERILDAAINLMSADMGSLQEFSPSGVRLLASRGFHSESSAFWEYVRVESASSCGLALSSGARIIVPDVEACDFMAGTGDLDAYRRSGIRAVQSTPLVSRSGQQLGMISTHWRRDLRPLDVLARQAADLIERARAEAALRESEQQARWLAAIVESSDDAIISIDLDGIITSWNEGAERIFGYLAEEVIGKPLLILIPPDRHDEETTILERLRRGERIDHYETVRKSKHGSLVDISLTVSPVRNFHGKIIGASKIARDITERKRSEAQIAILAREAEQLHELATNAAKYGALSVPGGYVEVNWSRAADGRLVLRWTEANGPAVNPPRHQGFGTRVIESMVVAQLKGEIRFAWRSQGLSCEITMPA